MNLLKKIMCGVGLAGVMLMCSCANGEEMSDNISESAADTYTGETEIAEIALTEAGDNGNENISESAAEAYTEEAEYAEIALTEAENNGNEDISEITAEAYTREAEYAEIALTEAEDNGNEDISYAGVTNKIASYYSRYISLNIEENEIAREEIEAAQAPSEGGTFVIFRAADNEPVRYRENLYGAMKQFEENYYIIGENEVYFTRLEKYYDTYHLEKADILNYVFTEYWIEGGEVYYLDRLNGKLVICGEDPVPKQFHEMAEADMIK